MENKHKMDTHRDTYVHIKPIAGVDCSALDLFGENIRKTIDTIVIHWLMRMH